jgi:hypothetical protein
VTRWIPKSRLKPASTQVVSRSSAFGIERQITCWRFRALLFKNRKGRRSPAAPTRIAATTGMSIEVSLNIAQQTRRTTAAGAVEVTRTIVRN